MICFNHNNINAVGVCSNCHKGLCSDCYQIVHNHLVCSEACATSIKDKDEINERAKRIYGMGIYATQKSFPLSAIACFVIGLIFTFFGIFNFFIGEGAGSSINTFILIMGLAFILIGILYWYKYKKIGLRI